MILDFAIVTLLQTTHPPQLRYVICERPHNPLETSKSIRITPKPHEIAVNAIKMVPHINKHLLLTVTGNKTCNFES